MAVGAVVTTNSIVAELSVSTHYRTSNTTLVNVEALILLLLIPDLALHDDH
jgi:hypothetical protein